MLNAIFRAVTPESSDGKCTPKRKGRVISPNALGSPGSARLSSPQLSLQDNDEDLDWFQIRAFHPSSEFRVSLEGAHLIAGVYTIVATFFLVCFRKHPAPAIFLIGSGLADAVFVADAVVSSITGFTSWGRDSKVIVMDVGASFHNWVKKWMVVDVLVAIPVVLLQYSTSEDPQNESLQSFLYTLQVLKLACVVRMDGYWRRLQRRNPGWNKEVMLGMALVLLLVTVHCLACLRFASVGGDKDRFLEHTETPPPVDMDECTEETHNCAPNANCTNSVGSFECACQHGFWGNGTHCTTCFYQPSFHARMSCFASPFLVQAAWDAAQNRDVDECANGIHDCHPLFGLCSNTDGSFTCECAFGYQGDGVRCFSCNEPDGVLNYMSYTEQYGCAFYWTVQTALRVGYGDVTSQGHLDRIFAAVVAMAAMGLLAYALSGRSVLAAAASSHHGEYILSRESTLFYLRDRKLPSQIQEEAIAQLDASSWSNVTGVGSDLALIRELPPGVRLRVFRRLHGDAFESVSLFGSQHRAVLFWHHILDSVQLRTFQAGDEVQAVYDEEAELCVLKSGEVAAIEPKSGAVRHLHRRPSHWGNGALFQAVTGLRRRAKLRLTALTPVQVFTLDLSALATLAEQDAGVRGRVEQFVAWERQVQAGLRFHRLARKAVAAALVQAQQRFRLAQMQEGHRARPRAAGRLR